LRISGVLTVARRWFVTNAFDGNLSILGLILGVRSVGETRSDLVLGAGLGVCAALAISQSAGNIMAERAERRRELKELESSMLHSLQDTVHEEAAATAPVIAGLIGGIAPAAYTALTLLPYVLERARFLDLTVAFYSSVAGILLSVFFLGVILGKISKDNLFISGLKMLGIGVLTAAVLIFLGA
jgi:predicted membrane protein (TIGR00267 family)